MKICSKCKIPKNLSDYSKDKYKNCGLKSNCKVCCKKVRDEKNYEPDMEGEKVCTICNEKQDILRFSCDKQKRTGRTSYCKTCENKRRVNRKNNNPLVKLVCILRSRLRHALDGGQKFQKTLDLIGCSTVELKLYLEKQFKDGMSWENHGLYGWHVDHKIPCSSFDLSKNEEQVKCFHYTNLQPLWAKENLSKGNRQ